MVSRDVLCEKLVELTDQQAAQLAEEEVVNALGASQQERDSLNKNISRLQNKILVITGVLQRISDRHADHWGNEWSEGGSVK